MEMKKEDLEGWQRYFTANALKQPFAQVWEPVADAVNVFALLLEYKKTVSRF